MPASVLILLLPVFALGIFFSARLEHTGACISPFVWIVLLICSAAGFFMLLQPFRFSVFFLLPEDSRLRRFIRGSASRTDYQVTLRKIITACLAACAVFAAGVLHYHGSAENLEADAAVLLKLSDLGGRHVISAQIIRAPVYYENGKVRFCAAALAVHHSETSMEPIAGLLSVTALKVGPSRFIAGDTVRFSAVLKPVRNFKTPGTFDYENWWALRHIRVKAFVPSPLLLVRTGHETSGPCLSYPRCLLEKARGHLMGLIRDFFTGKDQAAVASALLFGHRAGLSSQLSEAFSITGTGHLLAVSGLHMALAAMLVFVSVRWWLLRSEWLALRISVTKTATAVSMAAVVIYAGLAGFSPSATRAMIMILIFSLALLIERPHAPLNSLAAAAWILLAMSPFYLFDMAFQLSFAAVFFLILFSPVFRLRDCDDVHVHGICSYLRGVAVVSVVASLATAPLAAWYFQRISMAGPLLNMVLVPAVCFMILPCLIGGAALAVFWPAAADYIFWTPVTLMITAMLEIVEGASHIPAASFWIARPEPWHIILFWTALFLTGVSISGGTAATRVFRLRLTALLLLAAIPAGILYRNHAAARRSGVVLHVPDVGQGTCQVVEFPEDRLMVMDGGGMRSGTFDTGERIVGPFIRTLGYTHIDILAASHPETDHIGGLAALVRQFSPDELWTNSDENPHNEAWRGLMAAVREHGVRHRVFQQDCVIRRHGTVFQLFTAAGCSRATSRNSRSLVVRIVHKGHVFLLTGDIDRGRENCFLFKDPGHADIVMIPHHGSRTSSSEEFIKYLRPMGAIVSAGWRNYLGLPVPEVVNRWKSEGAVVVNTGTEGTVTVGYADGIPRVSTFCSGELPVH